MAAVDTRKSKFRKLRFETIPELKTEIEKVLQSHRSGQLKTTGNWTAGQILGHLASWIEYGYDGYPMKPPPFVIRWILKLMVPRMLAKGMSRGVRIPGVAQGTLGIEDVPVEEAARRLLTGLERLERGEHAPHDSPGFGKMSHADRIRLNLRHAELHLGFLQLA